MNRHTLLAGLALVISMAFAGCGGPAIMIEITTAPPASMEVNQSVSIAATVFHDGSSSGVDWSCTPVNTCGTFTPPHTASGATTVYQAPSAAGGVVITAASTKKPTANQTANVTINPVASASNLNGTYTFFFTGFDKNEAPYSVAGSVVLSSGKVTGGEQDYVDTFSPTIITADPIKAGTTATVGSDGRGTLPLTPTSASIPPESLGITVVNNNHVLITEFDTNATSSGSLDLQTAPTSVPTAGNAFALFDSADAFVFGGVLTSSGAAFTAGTGDDDLAGVPAYGFSLVLPLASSFTAPVAGRGTITLADNDPSVAATLEFAYYVVGPETFRLIEIDGLAFAAGSMYGQGSTSGAFGPGGPMQGNFAFGQFGENDETFGWYAAGGQFTTDGKSLLTGGVADINEGDGHALKATGLKGTGSDYFVDANGYGGIKLVGTTTDTLVNFGVYAVDPKLNVTDPNNTSDTSGEGGALMLDLDANSLGAGIMVPQSTGPTFSGNYAINQHGLYQTNTNAFSEFDIIGQVLSNGVSTVTGLVDFNDMDNTGLNANVTLTGTYAADGANPGRATAQISVNKGQVPTPENITTYQASSALLFHVDVDSSSDGVGTIALGVLEKQQ